MAVNQCVLSLGIQIRHNKTDILAHTALNFDTGERFLMNNQNSNRVNSWLTANEEQKMCA